MKFWLDTEFNDDDLISIALVSEDDDQWYECLECSAPNDWVAQNVLPVLGQPPLASRHALAKSLRDFIAGFTHIHIIADWPIDIAHICSAMIVGNGFMIATPAKMTFEIMRTISSDKSAIPHNALEDAKALRRAYLEVELKHTLREMESYNERFKGARH